MRRLLAKPLVAAGLALAVAGVAVAAPIASRDDGTLIVDGSPLVRVRVDSGLLFQSQNSRGGAPVLVAERLVPGESRAGDVTISNTGTLDGRYQLRADDLRDQQGRFGGVLSGRARLRITTGATELFEGTVAQLGTVDLGVLRRGQSRTYRFTVTLPDGGAPASPTTGDNVYQDARSTLTLRWSATSCVPPC